MAEDLMIWNGTKGEQYAALIPGIKAILEGENDMIANMANISAALKYQFRWLWVGFYLVRENELVLGPFQGPIACTRIQKGRGVCGKCWMDEKTIIVGDVSKFPGHISCNSLSQSEIVIPVKKGNTIIGVLDIDSEQLDSFDKEDQMFLEEITSLL